jgi:hypothetical protein
MTSPALNVKQIFAAPALWAFIAIVVAFMYPVLGAPVLIIWVACLYWALRAAFFNKNYTYFLGGILLFGAGAGTAFILIACITLAEMFFRMPKTSSYVAAPVGFAWIVLWFCVFYFQQRRAAWRDFQTTRANRYLSVIGSKVVWLRNDRTATPAVVGLAVGGGIGLVTIVGAFVGKENAQGAVVAAGVVGVPILLFGYGIRVIIGLIELRKLEKANNVRFPLPNLEAVQLQRSASWIGRLINPELRAIRREMERGQVAAATHGYSHKRK